MAILGFGLWTAISTARTIHRTFTPVYSLDEWTVVADLQYWHGAPPASRLWAQHNEHRIITGRLALLADLWLFHGRNVSLVIEIYLVQLCLALLFTWMCRNVGNIRGPVLISLGGFFAYCMFCPLQIENLYWGFQISFVLAGLGAAASFALMVWHAAKLEDGSAEWFSWPLFFAFVAALVAEFSLADGILTWVVLLWLAASLRLAKRTLILCAAVGATAVGLYLVGYVSPAVHSNPWLTIQRPLSLAKYITTYFASTWDASLPSFSPWPTVSEMLTVIAIIVALGAGVWALFVRPLDKLRAFLAANFLLTIGAAALTALGRLNFGIAEATASRYQSIALVFWAAFAGFILVSLSRDQNRMFARTAVQVSLLILLISTQGRFATYVRLAEDHQVSVNSAYAALAQNPPDLAALKPLHPSVERVPGWYEYMRAHGVGVNPLEFYNWGGYRLVPASSCWGSLDLIRTTSPGQKLAQGWAWDTTKKRTPDKIVLALPSGVVVGYGEIDTARPDVQAVMKISDLRTGWSGPVHAMPGSHVRAFAVLADSKSICPLNNERDTP